MENSKIESRYLMLCIDFRAINRCMKAAFYRPDYQKLIMCPFIKRLSQVFVSKHAVQPLKCSAQLLKHFAKLSRISEKTKILVESLKSQAACFCYNTPMLLQSAMVPTRFSELNYVQPICNIKTCKYSISIRGPYIWNIFLSSEEIQIPNIYEFKAIRKSRLLFLQNKLTFFQSELFLSF